MTRSALLLGSFVESITHACVQLELEIRHGLEGDLHREDRGCFIDFDVLRPKMPEVVREDDRLVESFRAGFVS
jgi:hypothetical protein